MCCLQGYMPQKVLQLTGVGYNPLFLLSLCMLSYCNDWLASGVRHPYAKQQSLVTLTM